MINSELSILYVSSAHTWYSHGGVWQKTVLVSSREMKTRNRNLDIKFIKMQDEAMRVTVMSRRGQEGNQRREKFGIKLA